MAGNTILHYTRAPLSHLIFWKQNFMWYFLSKMNITLTFLFSGNQTELSISYGVSPELCNNNNYCILFDFSILCSVSW